MCYRYYIAPKSLEMEPLVLEALSSPLLKRLIKEPDQGLITSGEVRPTNVAPVIATSRGGEKAVFPMKWGFQIPGRSLVINARSETAAIKPTFRDSWAAHRCIVPASSYIEWEHFVDESGRKKTGDKYRIRPITGQLTYLCGLYRIEAGLPVFTVLTRDPSDSVRRIHDRMPLILPEDLIAPWINPTTDPTELLPYALTEMELEIC